MCGFCLNFLLLIVFYLMGLGVGNNFYVVKYVDVVKICLYFSVVKIVRR